MVGSPAGGSSWRIGVRDPRDSMRVVAIVEQAPGQLRGVATSGCYERGAHLINPWTGSAAPTLPSATVTGPDLALADAFATALALAGAEGFAWLAAQPGYEALLVTDDATAVATAGLVVHPAD